jgi:hypothetical protein
LLFFFLLFLVGGCLFFVLVRFLHLEKRIGEKLFLDVLL